MSTGGLALYWLRDDLRLSDNPALSYALRHHASTLCVYIEPPIDEDDPPAQVWWRREALLDLSAQLGDRLIYRVGQPRQVLEALLHTHPIEAVYWNRRYAPSDQAADSAIKAWLRGAGLRAHSSPGDLLLEPWTVRKADDTPYRVFTPFFNAARRHGLMPPSPSVTTAALSRLVKPTTSPQAAIARLPQRPWMAKLAVEAQPTRAAALEALDRFAVDLIGAYAVDRDRLAQAATSQLSPYLRFGQISPREVVARVQGLAGAEAFIRELIWRDFSYYVMYHWPDSLENNMDKRFDRMEWHHDPDILSAWRLGQTGIPMVDAGMRSLWQAGRIHNRARMIVASFLTKHLLIDWREGARWFEYTLLDADLAINRMNWQWCAGSGVDAAPYFRIFNPTAQGQRFDPQGDYVRRWVPALSALPAKWVHQPWAAPPEVLAQAGVRLGRDYPRPIVDLKAGRLRALSLWGQIK
ncbi:DNA photolyase family protein [Myxococcota bacterium]|nr:DNA photolyase family protein [Myxococcota bacterium]MBU1898801.1 DNA photolyase family protein [Myxococcota bacterium]